MKSQMEIAEAFGDGRKHSDRRHKAITARICRMCVLLIAEGEGRSRGESSAEGWDGLVVYLPAVPRVSRWQSRFMDPFGRGLPAAFLLSVLSAMHLSTFSGQGGRAVAGRADSPQLFCFLLQARQGGHKEWRRCPSSFAEAQQPVIPSRLRYCTYTQGFVCGKQ